jgi:hypothetical protein
LTKQKALCVATRCTTAGQFIETFHRFCDEQSFFVATMNMRPVGLETPFSIQLADKTPVLRGLCVVLAAWTTPANQYKRPGIRLGIRRLTPESEDVFYQLQAMRTAAPLEVATEASEALTETPVPLRLPPIPTARRVSPPPQVTMTQPTQVVDRPPAAPAPRRTTTPKTVTVPPKEDSAKVKANIEAKTEKTQSDAPKIEERTPGSDFVLPANPLMNLTDESLEGFVDCTLYEETANFERAPEDGLFALDEPAPPPTPKPEAEPTFRPITSMPMDEVTVDKRAATPLPIPVTANTDKVVAKVADKVIERAVDRVVEQAVAKTAKAAEQAVEKAAEQAAEKAAEKAAAAAVAQPVERVTPVPAGEIIAVKPTITPLRRAPSSKRWWVLGGATVAASLAAVLVLATQSSGKPAETKPVKPAKPVEIAKIDPPQNKIDTTKTDETKTDETKPDETKTDETKPDTKVDGEETVAITDPTTQPVAGDGPCKLEINTTPAGTMVQVDGQQVGPSPITVNGPCTKRRVDLSHPRYKTEQRFIVLTPDKPGTLDVTLARPTHNLTVTSNPSGAIVSINGRRAGTTPTKVQLMGFSGIDVTIEKPGFEKVTKRVYSKVPDDSLSVSMRRELFFKGK